MMKELPIRDDLYEEVARYHELYRNCTAEQILQVMGEMWEFFFGRMTREEYEHYTQLREAMNQRVDDPGLPQTPASPDPGQD